MIFHGSDIATSGPLALTLKRGLYLRGTYQSLTSLRNVWGDLVGFARHQQSGDIKRMGCLRDTRSAHEEMDMDITIVHGWADRVKST